MSNRKKPRASRKSTLPPGVVYVDTSTQEGVQQLIDINMQNLIAGMQSQMGRMPTEDEVQRYIYGSDEERTAILEGK